MTGTLYRDLTIKQRNEIQSKVHRAIVKKDIIKNNICERCGHDYTGNEWLIYGHHEDYSKPLEIIWMCAQCHGQRHSEIRKELNIKKRYKEKS